MIYSLQIVWWPMMLEWSTNVSSTCNLYFYLEVMYIQVVKIFNLKFIWNIKDDLAKLNKYPAFCVINFERSFLAPLGYRKLSFANLVLAQSFFSSNQFAVLLSLSISLVNMCVNMFSQMREWPWAEIMWTQCPMSDEEGRGVGSWWCDPS